MMSQVQLSGKNALVTGSSQGLGRSIAKQLAASGCRVVVNCAHGLEKAEQVAAEIEQAGGKAVVYGTDISDEDAVRRMFAELGPVDILVNNARVDPYFRKPEMTPGQWWNRVLSVNLTGAFLCSHYFMEQAKSRGWGRIVNISSVRAFLPVDPNMPSYGASKAGMHALSRYFAAQGAAFGVTANTIAPGMVITENIDKRLTPEMKAAESAKIPVGRGASCEEIADAVLFVVNNGYVTGETININGGMYYAS